VNPSHRNLPLLLLHAREAAMSHFRPILKHFGLTDQQWRILRALSEAGDKLEPGQLAEECMIQKSSLTGILARMADLKWIDRHGSTVDQRRQLISLTAKGKALVDRMAPFVDRQYRLIADCVGDDTLNAIYRSLDTALVLLNREIASVLSEGAPRQTGPGPASAGRRVRVDVRKA
jgi:homoprotocatechuate degradation regulator HpaR